MTSTRVDTLIAGAGITGLAFANARSKDESWLVLERDAAPGGYCRTIHQDGFVWDYSGHFFHFRHPEIEAFLRARMPGQEIITVTKSAGILFGGVRVDFPFQKNIHQLPMPDFLDCLHDLHFREARPEHTFEDMLYARFGRGIAERFLIPYNEKLYACRMDALDPEAMGRFFPHADEDAIIRNFKFPDPGSYNATFTYPRGGAVEYVNALLADLPPERLALSESLVSLDLDAHEATTTARTIRYDRLVSSLPFPTLARAAALPFNSSDFNWNKVLVFNLGFDSKGQERDHWIYIPDRSISFYRVGYYDNIFGTANMSLYVEIGLTATAEVGSLSDWLERVLIDLRKLGLIDGQRLVSWHSVVLDPAYVHVTERGKRAFERLKTELAAKDVHTAGRYGGWTYCSIEDNIVEARALSERLA